MSKRDYQKDQNAEEKPIAEEEKIEEKPKVKRTYTKKERVIEVSKEALPTRIDKKDIPKRPLSEKQKANVEKFTLMAKERAEIIREEKRKVQEQADYERLKRLEAEGKILVKLPPKKPSVKNPNHWMTKAKKIVESKKEEEVESEVDDVVEPLPSPKRERSISPAVRQATEKVNNLIQKLETRTQQFEDSVRPRASAFVNPYSALLEKKRAR
jgi:uncharacterized protein YciI